MYDNIVNSITDLLLRYFEEYSVYTENQIQGFEEPCFYIQTIEVTRQEQLNIRHIRPYSFNIICFNNDKGIDDLYRTGDMLMSMLELLQVSDKYIRGQNISFRIEDEVLHTFVTYNAYVEKIYPEEDKFATFKGKVGIKNDEN